MHPCSLAHAAENQLMQWKQATENRDEQVTPLNPAVVIQEKWKPPPPPPLGDMYKTNWDMAMKSNKKRLGVGIIVSRDGKNLQTRPNPLGFGFFWLLKRVGILPTHAGWCGFRVGKFLDSKYPPRPH
jgi:hypothetical protein